MPALRGAERRRWVTPEPLNVAPALVGLPLATPWRRALAMGLDLLVLALVAESAELWLLAGLVLVVLQLRNPRHGLAERKRLGWLLAAVLVWLAASQAWALWQAGVRERAAAGQPTAWTLQATLPVAASAAAPRIEVNADEETPEQQIARLEAELKAARAAQPKTVREQAEELADAVAARFGWGIVYFSLLPAWWGGQTLGKRLLGLRVLQLTGAPVTVMTSLKRYGGYAAGLATGGLGFAQVWWDPNRQGLQDKAAHTVVIDLRQAARSPLPVPPAA
jgi:uncharacterized RDD family membrane protein YckC